MLRKRGVVGKFVEFFGPGLASLTIADRATIGNMAPEYGATCGFFPIDDDTIDYLTRYRRARPIASRWSRPMPRRRACTAPRPRPIRSSPTCSSSSSARSSRRSPGPKRPQDRVALKEVKTGFADRDGQGIQQGRRDRQARAGRRAASTRSRPRRRGDRRDHVLHQHVEPERDGRRRPARRARRWPRASRSSRG